MSGVVKADVILTLMREQVRALRIALAVAHDEVFSTEMVESIVDVAVVVDQQCAKQEVRL